MKSIFMIVYNKIENDARVQRAAISLSCNYVVYLFSIGKMDNEKIISLPSKSCESLGGIRTYLRFVIECIICAKKHKPDIIYAHDIFAALPLLLLKLLRVANIYIYDAHELFIKQKNRKLRFDDCLLYSIESRAIKSSNLVICANEKRSEIMKSYHKLSTKPVVVRNISYFPSINKHMSPEIYEQCKDFFNIPAFFVVYAGGMLHGRKLEILIDVIHKLGSEYKLLLVGNGPAYKSLKERIDFLNNVNIKIINAVPYDDLAPILKKADAGYMFYPVDTLNNIYCAPNKIFEYASAGLPIISNLNPSVKQYIDQSNIGCCDDNLSDAIYYVKNNKSVLKKNIEIFLANNKQENEAKKLLSEVNKVVKSIRHSTHNTSKISS